MLKKTITYVDYNGLERTEDFYFNLSKAEIMEMEMSTTGGLTEMISKIVSAQDAPAIIKVFKDLVLKAYGEKSPDGKRFVKNKEIADAFSQTEAYSQLFMDLATNADAAAAFVNGIVPAGIPDKASPMKIVPPTVVGGPDLRIQRPEQ
ncbi:MAG: hypothetical protein RR475_02280 [Clostridia bacterium]